MARRKRKNFSKATIAERFEHAGGRCEAILPSGQRCNAVLVKGRWRCDHDNPDALTGLPTFENARCVCMQCDGVKTPQDISRIAKAKRQHFADIRPVVDKPKIQSRGFAKRQRARVTPTKQARGAPQIARRFGL